MPVGTSGCPYVFAFEGGILRAWMGGEVSNHWGGGGEGGFKTLREVGGLPLNSRGRSLLHGESGDSWSGGGGLVREVLEGGEGGGKGV